MGALLPRDINYRFLIALLPAALVTLPLICQRWNSTGRRPGRRRTMRFALVLQFICLVSVALCGSGVFSRVVSALVLLAYGALFAADFIFFRVMGQGLGFDMMALGFRERRHVGKMSSGFIGRGDLAFVVLLAAASLLPALLPPWANWHPLAFGAAGLATLVFMGKAAPSPSGVLNPLGKCLWEAFRSRRSHGFKAETVCARKPFSMRFHPSLRWNILTLMNESLSRPLLEGPGADAMPAMRAFLRENRARVFEFPHAFSNSTASDVSYPSLFTGLAPTQSLERFKTNPLVWSAAAAAGYHTSLHTAWDLGWANLDKMVLDEHLDLMVDPKMLAETVVNDTGIDDLVLNGHAVRHLGAVAGPFFSVVCYNSQHIPCLVDETVTRYDLTTQLGRYLNSLTVLDACFAGLLEGLRQSGRLERTIIFFLSDHGEDPAYFDRPGADRSGFSPRADDVSLDLLSVPFWIYLPDGAMDAGPVLALRENQTAVVSNLDYYPTVLSAMGVDWREGDAGPLQLGGNDLFRSLPAERGIPCLNTGALRKWSAAPAGLVLGRKLLVYHDVSKSFELLDLDDPRKTNLWPAAAPDEKELWMARLERNGLWPVPADQLK